MQGRPSTRHAALAHAKDVNDYTVVSLIRIRREHVPEDFAFLLTPEEETEVVTN
jgi:hypothetical protein